MRVEIDKELCQGYLLCVNRLPDVFGEDEDGRGEVVLDGELPSEHEQEAQLAIEECPMQAIRAARPDAS